MGKGNTTLQKSVAQMWEKYTCYSVCVKSTSVKVSVKVQVLKCISVTPGAACVRRAAFPMQRSPSGKRPSPRQPRNAIAYRETHPQSEAHQPVPHNIPPSVIHRRPAHFTSSHEHAYALNWSIKLKKSK